RELGGEHGRRPGGEVGGRRAPPGRLDRSSELFLEGHAARHTTDRRRQPPASAPMSRAPSARRRRDPGGPVPCPCRRECGTDPTCRARRTSTTPPWTSSGK